MKNDERKKYFTPKQKLIMKNKSTFLPLIAMALLISSCNSSCTKKVVHKNIICYIDFSVNPNWDARINYYGDVINNSIIKNMSYNDRIVILPIDNGTTTNSQEILNNSLKKQFDYIPDGISPLDEDRVAEENLEKDKKAFCDAFNTNISSAKISRANLTKGTDITGALQDVSKYYQEGQENIIVLLSDMMNWSGNLKMEEGSFTAELIDKKLAELSSIEGKNVKVIVHTGDITNISSKHFSIVNEFWKKYFEKNNFVLYDYSSGGKAKMEELLVSRPE